MNILVMFNQVVVWRYDILTYLYFESKNMSELSYFHSSSFFLFLVVIALILGTVMYCDSSFDKAVLVEKPNIGLLPTYCHSITSHG